MKTLKAQIKSPLLVTAVNDQAEILNHEFIFVPIELNKIADTVTQESREQQPNFSKLEKEVVSYGMFSPIIVTINTREAYNHAILNVVPGFISNFDESKEFLCLFGNQRLAVARRNNFEKITSAIVPSPFWAIALHKQLP
jgi:hypothetical protein